MVIRKQPIISWLLDKAYTFNPNKIAICQMGYPLHAEYLCNAMSRIIDIREQNPDWGLPELLMPSFERAMKKSAKSFFEIDHQLFQDFSEDDVCGILLYKPLGTIVYGFGDNTLFVWLFKDIGGVSTLYNYFYFVSTERNTRQVCCCPTFFNDPVYVEMTHKDDFYSSVANILISYLAVKRYAKVETIIIPNMTISMLDDTCGEYKQKEKVRNESGQEVIVMDSRWFVKIVNDNDIPVRGFFRMQNKKDEHGEWYKELIYVDSFVRHGYHRKAKIEDAVPTSRTTVP